MAVKIFIQLILVTLPLLAANAVGTPVDVSIDRLAWLSGCWASDGGDAGSEEHWMQPAAGAMLGMNRTVRQRQTVAFEFLRIYENEGNSLTLHSSPSQQSSASFQLVSISQNEVIFENPEHDFPHRILYRLVAPDHLLGRIEGISKGEFRAIDFPMTRKSCGD